MILPTPATGTRKDWPAYICVLDVGHAPQGKQDPRVPMPVLDLTIAMWAAGIGLTPYAKEFNLSRTLPNLTV